MIRIAVVDDDTAVAAQLCQYVEEYSAESGNACQVTVYQDGDELVEQYRVQFDIILLDVDMPFLDGMSAAELIRRQDPEVIIIFITNMAQYAIRGYAVDALDYVLKPVNYFAFSQRLSKAIQRLKKREKVYIMVPVKGGSMKLEVNHIYYIESQGHSIIFHTSEGNIVSAGTLRSVEESLEIHHFCRGNKGYLINLEHVDGVRDGCAIVKGEHLLLSRARKAPFLEALTGYMGEMAK